MDEKEEPSKKQEDFPKPDHPPSEDHHPQQGQAITTEVEEVPAQEPKKETSSTSIGSVLSLIRYGGYRRRSKDVSTNTGLLFDGEQGDGDGSDLGKPTKKQRCLLGLTKCHKRALKVLPSIRKFLFWVPLRYGVYTIISCEQIFFSLRAYTRVLHLAMPSFFPQLWPWVATLELLLCILVLVSNVFLLVGALFNPDHIFVWIDIHLFEILVYAYLIIYLTVTKSKCVFDCAVLFSVYVIVFIYFIVTVDAFRKAWIADDPSKLRLDTNQVV